MELEKNAAIMLKGIVYREIGSWLSNHMQLFLVPTNYLIFGEKQMFLSDEIIPIE